MNYTGKTLSRRGMLAGIATMPALVAPLVAQLPEVKTPGEETRAALKDAKGTKLVLLGTGAGPFPGRSRHMTSHVMLSDASAYVVDCGLGVSDQFAYTGIRFSAIRSIFITHHHPDHNIEYGPFLLLGWVQGLKPSVQAFGPPPLKQMTEDILRSYRTTIKFWAEDFQMKPLENIEVQEAAAGAVMQDDNVRVSATVVSHPPVTPALAYRFDFKDRSIVFSGDTAPSGAVTRIANGADILVHEAMYVPALAQYIKTEIAKGRPTTAELLMAHMKAAHTPVEDVGRIAQEAGVKTLVLSHLTPAINNLSDADWRAAAAKHFKGEIIVGKDLMVI